MLARGSHNQPLISGFGEFKVLASGAISRRCVKERMSTITHNAAMGKPALRRGARAYSCGVKLETRQASKGTSLLLLSDVLRNLDRHGSGDVSLGLTLEGLAFFALGLEAAAARASRGSVLTHTVTLEYKG
jgi:hypothetical protein